MSEPNEKSKAGRGRVLQLLRRISQVVFLILFLTLFFKTEYRGTSEAELIETNAPVSIFLEMDPLVAMTTALDNTHALRPRSIRPDPDCRRDYFGTLFLRLDMPARYDQPFLLQLQA